jgi:hypothetical protein
MILDNYFIIPQTANGMEWDSNAGPQLVQVVPQVREKFLDLYFCDVDIFHQACPRFFSRGLAVE